MSRPGETLDPLIHLPGVRGALIVSADDGLVVANASMGDIDGTAVAALSASLVGKLRKACIAGGQRPPDLVHLSAVRGGVLSATGRDGLLIVAVVGPDANLGMLRLALRDAANGLG